MATTLLGPVAWSLDRGEDRYRNYSITFKVEAAVTDGPASVLATAGLPLPGVTTWNFRNDVDTAAVCKWPVGISPFDQKNDEPTTHWLAKYLFSNAPDGSCTTSSIDSPLLQPQTIEGSFSKYTKKGLYDRNGALIRTPSYELIEGQDNEWDANRPSVRIGQNVVNLELALFSQMVDTVNTSPMWGLPARCVKLSNVNWSKQFYGTCQAYYRRDFEFDVAYPTITGVGGWDKVVAAKGTKVLNGRWARTTDPLDAYWINVPVPQYSGSPNPNPDKPDHYMFYKDRRGNLGPFLMDYKGNPANTKVYSNAGSASPTVGQTYPILIEYYPESNFALLNIPMTL